MIQPWERAQCVESSAKPLNKILAGGAEAGATINVSLEDVRKVLELA